MKYTSWEDRNSFCSENRSRKAKVNSVFRGAVHLILIYQIWKTKAVAAFPLHVLHFLHVSICPSNNKRCVAGCGEIPHSSSWHYVAVVVPEFELAAYFHQSLI